MSSNGAYARYTASSAGSNPYGQSYSANSGYGGGGYGGSAGVGYGSGPSPGYGAPQYRGSAPSSGGYAQVCFFLCFIWYG